MPIDERVANLRNKGLHVPVNCTNAFLAQVMLKKKRLLKKIQIHEMSQFALKRYFINTTKAHCSMKQSYTFQTIVPDEYYPSLRDYIMITFNSLTGGRFENMIYKLHFAVEKLQAKSKQEKSKVICQI